MTSDRGEQQQQQSAPAKPVPELKPDPNIVVLEIREREDRTPQVRGEPGDG